MNTKNISKLLKEKLSFRKDTTTDISENLNDGQIHWVSIDSIHFNEELRSTYEQRDQKVKLIAELMKKGFDESTPIVVNSAMEIEEGNSRFLGAQMAGLTEVAIIVKNFKSLDDAKKWQRDKQSSARQLRDFEIFENFIFYENQRKSGNSTVFSNEALAEVCNVSPRLITSFRYIYNNTTSEELDHYIALLKTNDITFNKIEKEIKARLQPQTEGLEKSSVSKTTQKDSFLLGIKFACQELSKGSKITELLSQYNMSECIQNHEIVLSQSDLDLLKKFTK